MKICECSKRLEFKFPLDVSRVSIREEIIIEARISALSHKPVVELLYSDDVFIRQGRRIVHFNSGYSNADLLALISINKDLLCSDCHRVLLPEYKIKELYRIYLFSNEFLIDSYLFIKESLNL